MKKEQSRKWAGKRIIIGSIVGVFLGVILVMVMVVVLHYRNRDCISDIYNISEYQEIESAVPVQNVIEGDVGRMNGEDIAGHPSDLEVLYEILRNSEVSNQKSSTNYQLNGYILFNPSIECSVKNGKDFEIQWDYPSSVLRIEDQAFSIKQKDAEKLYKLFQKYHFYKGGNVQ